MAELRHCGEYVSPIQKLLEELRGIELELQQEARRVAQFKQQVQELWAEDRKVNKAPPPSRRLTDVFVQRAAH
jgi:hypothetical protein